MGQNRQRHQQVPRRSLITLTTLLLVVTLAYVGFCSQGQIECAVSAVQPQANDPLFKQLFQQFMSGSEAFWQQTLLSSLPLVLRQTAVGLQADNWPATVSDLLYRMRISTPESLLAIGIPVLHQVTVPDGDEVMLPANEPNVPSLVSAPEPISAEAAAQGWKTIPEMLVYHTHNIESYVPSSGKAHVYDRPDQTIMRVGSKLAESLTAAGVDVVHSKADNSSQNYTLAYSNSLKNITSALSKQPSIEYTFDIHRDAGPRTITTTVIEGQSTARIYIVVGVNTTLGHPNYQKNIAFAQLLHQKLNQLYPGLSRGVRITDRSRYNQHVRDKALLIEVGGDKNTMDEALRAASFLSKAIVAVAKDLQK